MNKLLIVLFTSVCIVNQSNAQNTGLARSDWDSLASSTAGEHPPVRLSKDTSKEGILEAVSRDSISLRPTSASLDLRRDQIASVAALRKKKPTAVPAWLGGAIGGGIGGFVADAATRRYTTSGVLIGSRPRAEAILGGMAVGAFAGAVIGRHFGRNRYHPEIMHETPRP